MWVNPLTSPALAKADMKNFSDLVCSGEIRKQKVPPHEASVRSVCSSDHLHIGNLNSDQEGTKGSIRMTETESLLYEQKQVSTFF